MCDKYLETIIGGAIGLAGVVLGFLLQLLSNSISERRHIKGEFAKIKNTIYSTTTANNLFPELLKLKQFFVRNSQYLKKEGNSSFFQKWLMEPLVEEAFTGIGYWTKEKMEEMFQDLAKTEL